MEGSSAVASTGLEKRSTSTHIKVSKSDHKMMVTDTKKKKKKKIKNTIVDEDDADAIDTLDSSGGHNDI